MTRLIPAIAAWLLIATPAFAQTSAAAPAPPPAPPPGWSGQASLSFVDTSGNSHARTLGLDGQLVYHLGTWTATERAAYARSTSDGILSAETLTSDVLVDRQITTRVTGYGRLDYLRNQFAGIDDRVATDAGIGYELLPPGRAQTLTLTGGFGYSHEADLSGFTQSFPTDDAGASYAWKLSKTSAITDDAKFTGSLADAGDWRLRNTAAVTAAITSILALKLSHRLDFVNQPVHGFGRTDQITSASLVVSF